MRSINKIFIIGFNKCATRALHRFFLRNNIPSIHCRDTATNSKAALNIFKNKESNKKLLDGIDQYICYSDLEHIWGDLPHFGYAQYLFKEFDHQYPNSKFILNTRNVDQWIESRKNHGNGNYLKRCKKNYDRYFKRIHTNEDVIEIWRSDWREHHKDVIQHFQGRPNDLLIFNINDDSPQKIVNFFPRLSLNSKYYTHKSHDKSKKI